MLHADEEEFENYVMLITEIIIEGEMIDEAKNMNLVLFSIDYI